MWSDWNWTWTQNHLVLKRTLNHLAKLDIQGTIECGFTLKRVRDMTRTYSLSFVFWTPALTGPNCYFQKHCTSKILHLNLMVVSKQHPNLFYFDRTATDLIWPLVNGRFGSVTVLWDHNKFMCWKLFYRCHNCFFHVLS